jgi:hypothetical protein
MFGHSTPVSNAQQPAALLGLRVQTSSYGQAVPLNYGTNRLAGKLIWYGDFTAVPHSSPNSTSGGGKGGGAAKTQAVITSYTYTASVIILLCEGTIDGVLSMWDTKGKRVTTITTLSTTIPTSPYQITPAGSVFVADVGVTKDASYDVIYDDYGDDDYGLHKHKIGTQKIVFNRVASSPAAGEYSVSGAGLYTFNAADAGTNIIITFSAVGTGFTSPMGEYNFTFFNGASPQTPWGFMTTNHPTEARGYSGYACAAASGLNLGDSGELGNYNFETKGLLCYGGAILDCDPRDLVKDWTTHAVRGVGFPSSYLDANTSFSNYCRANGFFLSPYIDTQSSVASLIETLCKVGNAGLIWSEGLLKIKPYGDTTAVGNGATYSPNTTPVYDLNKDDYLAPENTPAIKKVMKDVSQCYNVLTIEFLDRSNNYNPSTVQERDQGHIETYGIRPDPTVFTCHWIKDKATASLVANHLLKRAIYIDAEYEFTIGVQYSMLEPMDLVTITDAELGYNKKPVRITAMKENGNHEWDITAEEFPFAAATATLYPKQDGTGYVANKNSDPDIIGSVLLYEPPRRATSTGVGGEIWLGANPVGAEWGGCNIWVSDNGTDYKQVGRISNNMRVGSLTAGLVASTDPRQYSYAFC